MKYADPKKQAKLEEAIHRGYIIRSTDDDGIERYKLTRKGVERWLFEGVIMGDG